MSALHADFLALRWQACDQLRAMGLFDHEAAITAVPATAYRPLRERLSRARIAATAVHSAANHASERTMLASNPLGLLSLATEALKLEALVAAAIVAIDRCIDVEDAKALVGS